MDEEQVVEYRFKNAIVRMHGYPDMDRVKSAAERYMRRLMEIEVKKQQETAQQNTEYSSK